MDKRQKEIYTRYSLMLLLGGFIFLVLMVIVISIVSNLFDYESEKYNLCLGIGILTAVIGCSIYGAVVMKKWTKANNACQKERIDKVKDKLTGEYQKVLLNRTGAIPQEKVECQAKIDEEGNITCKIHVDYEVKNWNYERFLEFFEFPDE